MPSTDYTDLIAHFTDELAVETLARFIASQGISCDVGKIADPIRAEWYGVRIQRSRVPELRRLLNLKPVANQLSPSAAHLLAGSLARDDIPCYIGGEHTNLFGDYTVPIRETQEPGCMVAVPESFFSEAMRVVNQEPLSDAELTKLALEAPPDPDDPP